MQVQVRLCTAATLAAAAPSMLHQLLRPSPQGLLLCMANTAFAFFLFSFQVSASLCCLQETLCEGCQNADGLLTVLPTMAVTWLGNGSSRG